MATKATGEPRYPRAVTFTLHLRPPETSSKKGGKKEDEKGEYKSKKGKATQGNKLGVMMKLPIGQINWKDIKKGDVVQFVPYRQDDRLKGARVQVRFVGKDLATPTSPFDVDSIRSTSFHKVTHEHKLFCAICCVI